MNTANLYTNKINSVVSDSMKSFTNNDCVLVRQDNSYGEEFSVEGNCHINVQKLIKKFGGKQIYGWLLIRDNSIIKKGIWLWMFHSIWEKPNGELVDTTQSYFYKNKQFNTFWIDSNRESNLKEGIGYNTLVIFSDDRIASLASQRYSCNIRKGNTYWTLPSMSNIRTLDQHDGKYRMLNQGYDENHRLLKDKYGIEIIDGRLTSIKGHESVNDEIMFDFNLGSQ